jgi:type IV secretion system protein VirD4
MIWGNDWTVLIIIVGLALVCWLIMFTWKFVLIHLLTHLARKAGSHVLRAIVSRLSGNAPAAGPGTKLASLYIQDVSKELARQLLPGRTQPAAPVTYGSARWASEQELDAAAKRKPNELVLGETAHGQIVSLSQNQQEQHVLVIGPTGQGKSSNIIIPGLLREYGQRSAFVIDPKSELHRLTAGAVARHLQVLRFAPTDPGASHTYNPLAYIRSMDDAQDVARAWLDNTGRNQANPFFDRNAEGIITAIVLHITQTEPNAQFSRIADYVTMSYGKLSAILDKSASHTAQAIAGPLLGALAAHQNLISGLMADLAGRFTILLNPTIRAVTSSNTLDFERMANYPQALYLNIPASQALRLKPLSALFLMQMFGTWIRSAEQSATGQLARPIACYLDEFCNAGRIPHFEEYITMLRSMRVSLLLAIQNFAQLDYVYGEDVRPTIQTNATTHIILPGCGQDETDYYSARIGDATVQAQSTGRSFTPALGIIDILSGKNRSTSEQRRRLITPDEIRTMAGQLLIISGAAAPMQVTPLPYYQDAQLKALANLPTPAIQPAANHTPTKPQQIVQSAGNTGPQSLLP